MKAPKVSVIIAVYNGQPYLEQAIASVLQQGVPLELILIDDGSVDRTWEIIQQAKMQAPEQIVCLRNEQNLGVAKTRNRGIEAAKGDYIAFLDADDWWAPDKLKKQLNLLERTGAVLCCTGRELMRPDGQTTNREIPVAEKISYRNLLRGNSISCSSVLAKRGPVQQFKMSHDELHEDYILWLRILQTYGPACGIAEPLLKSRMSTGGKSRNKFKSARMTWGVYRFLGFGLLRTMFYFACYTMQGIRKYYI